ncbi:hydroxyacylglutathione hydrolase [bacterium]|nr:hydroxyacylglutathione hydrolase [bacterium]
MRVFLVPTLFDNYTYLIVDEKTRECVIVDCPEVDPVLKKIKDENLKPVAIWCTHHHPDHVAGNEELLLQFDIPVYGSLYDFNKGRVPRQTHALKEGDVVCVGAHGSAPSLQFRVLDIPAHTLGHIAFYGHGALFCGDTLFACGCGRLFEGTPGLMYAALNKLKNLPDNTLVYCGHEYTEKNMQFALELEPGNVLLQKAIAHKTKVPTTIASEKKLNPFMRWDDHLFTSKLKAQGYGGSAPEEFVGWLRTKKDHW